MSSKLKGDINNVLEKTQELFSDCDENKKRIIAEIRKVDKNIIIKMDNVDDNDDKFEDDDKKSNNESKKLKNIEVSTNLKINLFRTLNDVIKLKGLAVKLYKDSITSTTSNNNEEVETENMTITADEIQKIHTSLNNLNK